MIRLKSLLTANIHEKKIMNEQSTENNAAVTPDVKLLDMTILTGTDRLKWDYNAGYWRIKSTPDIQNVVRKNSEVARDIPNVTNINKKDVTGTIQFIIRKNVHADGGITSVKLIKVKDTMYALQTNINLGDSNNPGKSDALVTLTGFVPGYIYILYDDQDSSQWIKFEIPSAEDIAKGQESQKKKEDKENKKDVKRLGFKRGADILSRKPDPSNKLEGKLEEYVKLKNIPPEGVQIVSQADGQTIIELWERTSSTIETIPLTNPDFNVIKQSTLNIETTLQDKAIAKIKDYFTKTLKCKDFEIPNPLIPMGSKFQYIVDPIPVKYNNTISTTDPTTGQARNYNGKIYNVYIKAAVGSYFDPKANVNGLDAPTTSIYYVQITIEVHPDYKQWKSTTTAVSK